MKRWKKGVIGVGIGLLVAGLGVGIWQRENAQAIWEGMKYSEDELKTQMETSKEKVHGVLEDYGIEGIRDLTVEEEEKLMKGELSVEEVLDLIMVRENKATPEDEAILTEENQQNHQSELVGDHEKKENDPASSTDEKSNKGTSTQSTSTQSTKVQTKQIVEKYVQEMYTLQATFLSELGKIEARAREAYAQLPEEERNLSAAKKLAPAFISQGLALENSCDSQVDTLLSEFETELKKVGASTTIVNNMKEAYQTQKRLKKASYLLAIK